jgi:hypothetical protein
MRWWAAASLAKRTRPLDSLCVEVGGAAIAISGDLDVESPEIIDRLLGFSCDRAPDLVLDISRTGLAPGPFCAEPFAQVEVVGDVVTASREDFRLQADLAAGRGTLEITPDCGTLPGVLRVLFSRMLPAMCSSVLVHGGGVVLQGRAWAFIGESGAGKSTVAGQLVGWPILSDEIVVLGAGPDGVGGPKACGTPLSSKPEYPGLPRCESLGGIFVLSQGEAVQELRLESREAVAALLERVVVPGDAGGLADRLVEIALGLARTVPVTALTLPGPPGAREYFLKVT